MPTNDKITGYTKHGEEQVLGRDGGVGVSNDALIDTVNDPIEIVVQGSDYGPTYKYISEKAVVVLNEIGEVITAYARGSMWTRGGK